MEIKVTGIKWDADNVHDVAHLPTEMIIAVPGDLVNDLINDEDELHAFIENELSNQSGFTHDGWDNHEIIIGTPETASNANDIIKALTVQELLDEIATRAVEAGAIDSKSQLALLALKSMSASEKDQVANRFGNHIENTDEVFAGIEDYSDQWNEENAPEMYSQFLRASQFGISYINGY